MIFIVIDIENVLLFMYIKSVVIVKKIYLIMELLDLLKFIGREVVYGSKE